MVTPLDGSKIKIENESGSQKLVIPQPPRGLMTYLSCIFILFWLGMWAFGWIAVASKLLKGGTGPTDVFFMFWLAFWTVGGIIAIWMFYRSVRPSVPETLVLSKPFLVYDSGIPPLRVGFGSRSQKEMWKKLFQKRIRTEFDQAHLKTLCLREFEGGNRLTMDQGARRIEIGKGASEPEREWLYELLRKEYGV
ncbi:MAG: hypothetical protein ACYS0H_12610 [Planctomycetota bacterium]|jgi:hypothetical protein